LARTSVTPNQVTTLRLTAGISAAACFAVGGTLWPQIGGGMFVFAMVLDRADGELARMTAATSPGGHKFDLIADTASNALAFIGLGIGLRESALGLLALPLGVFAGAAVAAVLWLVMRMEEMGGARAAELGGFAGFDPDDAMLAVPVAVWLGWSVPLIYAAAIGAPAVALVFFFMFRRRLRQVTADSPGSGEAGP